MADAFKNREFLPHFLRVKWRTSFGRRITPPFVTLFVTTRCDEHCIHCFYWEELNPKPNHDMHLEEYEKSLASMDDIYNLFIGGGEPFLREDLAEIVLAAARLNSVANVYVPTNGQHTHHTLSVLERTLSNAPQMRFHLNLSLDSTDEAQYDRIRGKQKAYRRMMETWKAIQPLRHRFPNLVVHTLTTVMRENQDQILDIYQELKTHFKPDGINFNYIRQKAPEAEQLQVNEERYQALRRQMEEDARTGTWRNYRHTPGGMLNDTLDREVRRTVARTVEKNAPQFSCVAGRLACVIYSNGDVVECEIKNSPIGNLRLEGYDFRKIWFAESARQIAHAAANGCYCTHECGHYSSQIYSVSSLTKTITKAAIAQASWKSL